MRRRSLLGFLLSFILLSFSSCATTSAPKSSFSFPPEWAPQEAMWLGWSDETTHHPVQVEIIRALVPTVPIRLFVMSDSAQKQAEDALRSAGVALDRVTFVPQRVGNAWIRDAGPRFVSNGRRLAIADFAWSWYGYPEALSRGWKSRAGIDDDVAKLMGIDLVTSELVSEGGALDVSDTMILTYRETAEQRNPGVPLQEIEAEYLRVYGKEQMLWLSRAPVSDRVTAGPKIANYVGWGANGHIDEFARFVNNSTIVVAEITEDLKDDNPLTRADYEILKENLAELRAARNSDGKPFEVITLPVPTLRYHVKTRRITAQDKESVLGRVALREFAVGDEAHFVPAVSYLNFVVSNGVVLVPAYWREGLPESERQKDEIARRTLQRLFSDRRVVQIHPIAINWEGGGMHCMTQQQPLVAS